MKKMMLIGICFLILGVRVEAKEVAEEQEENYQSEDFCESKILTSILEECDEEYWNYTYSSDVTRQYGPCDYRAWVFLDDATKFTYDIAITLDENSGTKEYIHYDKERIKYNISNNPLKEISKDSMSIAGLNNWQVMQFSGFDISMYEEVDKILSENLNPNYYKYGIIKSDNYQVEVVSPEEEQETFMVRLINYSYYINEGDTLSEIAEKVTVTKERLMELNPNITDPNVIYADTMLKIM